MKTRVIKESSSRKRQNTLILKHLAYARNIARKTYKEHYFQNIELEDLISAAYTGLCEAASRYDPSKGELFKTYAYPRIYGATIDYYRRQFRLRRKNSPGLPSTHNSTANLPTEIDAIPKGPASLQSFPSLPKSLIPFNQIQQDMDTMISTQDTPEDIIEKQDIKNKLHAVINQLPHKQQLVIRHRYFKDQSSEDTQKFLEGFSKSWFSRTHLTALSRIEDVTAQNYGWKGWNHVTA